MRGVVAAALLLAAASAIAQGASTATADPKASGSPPAGSRAAPPAAEVDPQAHPAMAEMMQTLRNGSQSSRYCARTGGMFIEADGLLRQKRTEKQVVDAMVAKAQGRLQPDELQRFRQLAAGVAQMAAGFGQLSPESAAVAYTQSCLGSTRSAPGTRDQKQLNERFGDALACDKRHAPGSLDAKECVAKAFRYR